MAVDPDEDGEDEWRFSLDDLEAEEQEAEAGKSGNVAGTITPEDSVEPGNVNLENALFVVAGMLLAVLVIAGFVLFL